MTKPASNHSAKRYPWVCSFVVGLLVLGVVNRLPGFGRHSSTLRVIDSLVSKLQSREVGSDDFHAQIAGYYEGIEHSLQISRGPENEDFRVADGFLRYDLKPNVKRRYEAGMRITNSLGMPNPEYGYRKPPHTRRIALLGDSISLGPYGHDFEALLEARLNRDHVTPEVQRFEILNFAVPGYSLVQMMDRAREKAPQFHPDVYMVALSNQEVYGSRKHLARLLSGRNDLKYDFLRSVAVQAGIQRTDQRLTILHRLTPFFIPITRWALEQIRDQAAAGGAQMVIVLVPAAIDPRATAADFDELRPAMDNAGVPVIDLRDTFRSANLRNLQVIPDADIHPNLRGHEMIFENLYAKLRAEPAALAAVAGTGKLF